MDKNKVRQGAAIRIPLTVQKKVPGGFEPVADYFTGVEEIEAFVWPGDDRARAATLPSGWTDAPMRELHVDVTAEASAALAVGWYQGVVTRPDLAQDLAYFELEVEATPGSASAPAAYHTYADLTAVLPYVKDLADQMQEQSGFAEVAGLAKRWIDGIILGAVPRGRSDYGRPYSTQRAWFWGDNAEMYRTISETLATDWLPSAGSPGDRIKQASVYYAIGEILRRAVGFRAPDGIVALGETYTARANALMSSGVVYFAASGGSTYSVQLGCTNTGRYR